MTYQEKLKDPRWKEKRVEILERDKHTCQECFGPNKDLHVHHKHYKRNTEPWDYSNNKLTTLCANCHKQEHYFLNDFPNKEWNKMFNMAFIEYYGEPKQEAWI